jgi:hypothetical protein
MMSITAGTVLQVPWVKAYQSNRIVGRFRCSLQLVVVGAQKKRGNLLQALEARDKGPQPAICARAAISRTQMSVSDIPRLVV